MLHQKGPITSTFTADWFLRQGQGRELMGEWMKLTSVRSQDQRRILQANSHTFPTNAWIYKITKGKQSKGKQSDRCDLCRALWISKDRFRTEKELPEQTLGHIQHTCEDLIRSSHRCSPPMLATDPRGIGTAKRLQNASFCASQARNASRLYGMTSHPNSRIYRI
jgi:hypothetical protein